MSFFSNQRLINAANPVNRSHPLARDLTHWWMSIPGLMGGEYMHDLVALPRDPFACTTHAQRFTTTAGGDTYSNAPTWGSGTNRPGGFGHMVNPAFTSPSGIMQGGDALGANGVGTFDFTLVAAFNIISFKDTSDCIMGQMGVGTGGIVVFVVDTTHLLRFSMGTSVPHAFSGTTALTAEKWNQVAVTWTSVGPLAAIYLNGTLETTSAALTVANRALPSGARNYIFSGNPNTSSARPLNARFDDFRVYNRCLSMDEVRAIYFNSLTGYPDILNRVGQVSFAQSAVTGGNIKYRRTFSQFGTHSGGRQVMQ